jgi:hypothetical protein
MRMAQTLPLGAGARRALRARALNRRGLGTRRSPTTTGGRSDRDRAHGHRVACGARSTSLIASPPAPTRRRDRDPVPSGASPLARLAWSSICQQVSTRCAVGMNELVRCPPLREPGLLDSAARVSGGAKERSRPTRGVAPWPARGIRSAPSIPRRSVPPGAGPRHSLEPTTSRVAPPSRRRHATISDRARPSIWSGARASVHSSVRLDRSAGSGTSQQGYRAVTAGSGGVDVHLPRSRVRQPESLAGLVGGVAWGSKSDCHNWSDATFGADESRSGVHARASRRIDASSVRFSRPRSPNATVPQM